MEETKVITSEEQLLIWHTKTAEAFSNLNFDKILYPSNIVGTESYIIPCPSAPHIEGYVVNKRHKNDKVDTVYFVRSCDVTNMPIEIINTLKVHYAKKVYNLVQSSLPRSIVPQKVFDWTELIDYSGIPTQYHTNPIHYILYKNKVLYARTKDQVYYRVITKSGFGKDKYKESVRQLLNYTSNLSDPTVANLFYLACHNKDITINEMPDDADKRNFYILCKMLIKMGDGSNVVDNRARATEGTYETANTSRLSVNFIHNVPEYYKTLKPPQPIFEEIMPYNVICRYYYNLYTGFLKAKFPQGVNFESVAQKFSDFIKNWIKSALWYEENWNKLLNKYPDVNISKYSFPDDRDRFNDHFIDFARCLSHYAKTKEQYLELLEAEYKSHENYEKHLHNNGYDSFWTLDKSDSVPKMVEELVTDSSGHKKKPKTDKEKLLKFIEEKGEAEHEDILKFLDVIDKDDVRDADKLIETLLFKGDIFEVHKGRYKLL